jgi:sialidase-1
MIRFSQGEGQPEVLLHSIPADTVMRRNVSIAVSYDEGRTWPVRKTVWNREAGYSSLTRLEDGSIGLLTEVGDWESGFEIWFTRLSFEWLTDKTNGEQFACDNDDE